MKLTSGDVDAICGLVLDLCGIYLDESKGYLIETRLADLAQRAGCSSYADLARRVRRGDDVRLQRELVDAITTNETLFFRDMSPFEAMRHKAIPELIDSKANTPYPKRLRIWSAACSTGQEPYSIAMLLHDMLPDPTTWDIRIVGTDISDEAIARASRGWYAPHESARGLPPEYLARYFREEQGGWRVSDPIRACVCFERRNLLESFASLGKFDIVLCRNVAIYFTAAARSDLFQRVAAAMNPGGYLFVGSQECLADLGKPFEPQHHCRAVYYRPTLAASPAPPAGVAPRMPSRAL